MSLLVKIITSIFIIIPVVLWQHGCQENNILPDVDNPPPPHKLLSPPNAQTPRLLNPPDSTKNVKDTLTVSWTLCRDVSSYSLQVSKNKNFHPTFLYKEGIKQTSYGITGLKGNTTYYWRVRATNSKGSSAWSEARSFTTINHPPNIPKYWSPLDGTKDQPRTIGLYWSCDDIDGDLLNYDVYFGTDNPPLSKVSSFQVRLSYEIYNLGENVTYYWRIIAKDSYGDSSVGPVWKFTTLFTWCPDIPTIEYAGKIYNTVRIGKQCWLKENLNVGIMIDGINNATNNGIIEKYCWDDDLSKCELYGGFYQWKEAMLYDTTERAQGICPPGWHIPTYAEFQICSTAVRGQASALIAVGQGEGTNSSGFSALLCGECGGIGGCYALGYAYYYTSTGSSDFPIRLVLGYSMIHFEMTYWTAGLSIRCIKD